MRMIDHIEKTRLYYELEEVFEWRKWANKIPYMTFPPHWKVKIVPPFAAAMIRFWVTKGDMPDDHGISVYLDCYETLGCWDREPYWEIYPHDGDTFRCDMADVDKLFVAIEEAMDILIKNKLEKK
jgi:hypothetical protein